jgi:hypothetical protein
MIPLNKVIASALNARKVTAGAEKTPIAGIALAFGVL